MSRRQKRLKKQQKRQTPQEMKAEQFNERNHENKLKSLTRKNQRIAKRFRMNV
jgi:hypothetical protein